MTAQGEDWMQCLLSILTVKWPGLPLISWMPRAAAYLSHAGSAMYAEKGYCTVPARHEAAQRGDHLAAIQRSNITSADEQPSLPYSVDRAFV